MKKITLFLSLVIVFFLGGNDISLGGELIDAHNWEKYKDQIPKRTILEAIKNGRATIKIVPTKPMAVPEYYKKATEKYKGTAKLTPKGHLPNALYKGGKPFPEIDPKDPMAGTKIFWNWNWRFQGDDQMVSYDRYCYDKVNRRVNAGLAISFIKTVGRGTIPPKPTIPGTEHLEQYYMIITTYPRDAAGTVTLGKRYNDPDKYDDMWRFFPSIRRVRRLPSTERYAAMPPSVFILDDTRGFSGKITHFIYKLLGEKKMLAPVHVPPPPYRYKMRPGYPFPLDLDWELRDCWVVEQTPRPEIYPKYAYSKRIFYIDKECWGTLVSHMYDKKGECWKEMVMYFVDYTTEGGEKLWDAGGTIGAHDLKTRHTTTTMLTSHEMDSGLTQGHFIFSKLLEFSRMGRMRP